jgi:hypothetical protein
MPELGNTWHDANAFKRNKPNPSTSAEEKRLALQFLLHFLGDVHQPLHASDNHDKGGNDKKVKAEDIATNKLHLYWDTEFIKKLESDPNQIASRLINSITPGQKTAWSGNDASTCAK